MKKQEPAVGRELWLLAPRDGNFPAAIPAGQDGIVPDFINERVTIQ